MSVLFSWTNSENKNSNNENPSNLAGALNSVLEPNTHIAVFSRAMMNIAAA